MAFALLLDDVWASLIRLEAKIMQATGQTPLKIEMNSCFCS